MRNDARPATAIQANYVVVFTSRLRTDAKGYEQAAQQMLERVRAQPGFVEAISLRGEDGLGVTLSYWDSAESILQWRDDAEHAAIRAQGRADWYQFYSIQIGKIERSYHWKRGQVDE